MKQKKVKSKSPRAKVLVVIERLEKVVGAVGAKDAAITTCTDHAYCAPSD
ncbi:MAG TPA: hypothetical protein VF516_36535 [Kofleriaceae bacterium]